MRVSDIDIHLGAPARLAIVGTLAGRGAGAEPLPFSRLKAETGLADGNLHVQTRKLIEAGYVEADKMPSGNRTVTGFRLTPAGLERYLTFVGRLAGVVGGEPGFVPSARCLRGGRGKGSSAGDKDDSRVW